MAQTELITQEWADALMMARVSAAAAKRALELVREKYNKPPAIADFLKITREIDCLPASHRPFFRRKEKLESTTERESKLKAGEEALKNIIKMIEK